LTDYKNRAVGWWLITGVAMIIIQTMLGGITRLSGSGLSITEWQPILGSIPPMNEAQWNKAFDGYKHIAQFKYLNSDFTLSDFKSIYFWEWLHREWARMLGVVFGIGFVYFLVKKYIHQNMIRPMIILVLLGALQGLIGWVMVSSGLNDTNLYVDHIKLAIHFIAAMGLACYTLWFALQLMVPEKKITADSRLFKLTLIVTILLVVQLIYGAFMAGLKAASAATTWPTINGMWIPDGLLQRSFINNVINVHFIHRYLAYTLLVAVIVWYIKGKPLKNTLPDSLYATARNYTVFLITAQVVLGIITVINATHITPGKFGIFEYLAEMHQMVAMLLLMSLIVNLFALYKRK
jgi:cytochrome c oxidase assembly protein subunit 15